MTVDIEQALTDKKLLGAAIGDVSSWSTWIVALKSAFGLELDDDELETFASIAGSRKPPTQRLQELWCVAGRGSGKSRISAAIATYLACFQTHDLDAGEHGFVLTLAASRDQAKIVYGYCLAFLRKSPILRKMIKNVTTFEIQLMNNVTIAVHSNSFRLIRGRTLLACIFDEVAFWRDDLSANPDVETYRAVRPSLARTGGMLIGISSPYRRSGLLYQRFKDIYERDDPDVLIVRGGTARFNPTISQLVIDKEIAKDPEGGRSEWEAEFRSDIAALLDDAVIEAAIDPSRPLELPPRGGRRYLAFVDPSAGRHDSFTLTIGHLEKGAAKGEENFVGDVVRGRSAPFNDPPAIAREFSDLARQYGCTVITGDAFAGEWVAGAFKDCGMRYETSKLPKSALYLKSLPHWNRNAVSIPNLPQLVRELRGLERRTHRSGRDTVDHGARGADDFANSLCGCMYLAFSAARKPKIWVGGYAGSGRVSYRPDLNPHMRDELSTGIRYCRVDENGNELGEPQSLAVYPRR